MVLFLAFAILSAWACLVRQATALSLRSRTAVCEELNEALNDVVFLQDDPEYPDLRTENWSQTAWRSPACIFVPTRVEDLQTAVNRLVQSNATFAIRSGGHSPSPQAANIDGGVLIDLSGFNDVVYDEAGQVARVGSGLTWGQVYSQLDPFGVTVVGGRVSDVGVGGLTLGGGLSYLSDLYGLVCDNVVNFEVVLADGSIVNANATDNVDLFWSLKGGINNFGIVTAFTLKTYPIDRVWGGIKAYSMDSLPDLFDAMFEYQSAPNKDPYANLMLQGYLTNDTIGVVLNMIYLKPEESPSAFAPFYHINTTADFTQISSFSEFISGQGPPSYPPRLDWRTTSFKPSKAHYEALTGLMLDSEGLAKIKSVTSGTVAFGLQPISTRVIEEGLAHGGNALGLLPSNQTWFVIDSGAWFPEDDALVHSATREIVQGIEESSKADGVYVPYLFMNDASWDQDVISHYGAENVARLKEVQAKYDPHHVFRDLVPGGFKLP